MASTQIEILEITNDLLFVDFNNKSIIVDRPAFESWVDEKDGRDWGTNDGNTGLMLWDEYYSHSNNYSIEDLSIYLTVRNGNGSLKSIGNIFESVKRIV